jgi:uncharacterized protein (DUF362 family)/Pyruvate/2-oxoacid:ferredoxin oxidoreductase delta subunit
LNKAKVSIVRCADYKQHGVEGAVKIAVELLGGIEKFVRPGSKVLIKPNLLSARAPEEGVNAHPEVIRAVARIIKTITPHVLLGDSPGGWGLKDIDEVYEKAGIKRVCLEENIRLVKFDKAVMMDGFPIASIIKEADAIISIPKMKSHATTILTGAVKNMFGAVVGLHKAQCHLKAPLPRDFAPMLAHVHSLVRPALSIMDGIVGMDGEGPAAGRLRNFGVILASGDAVALDAVFAEMAGIDHRKVLTTQEAQKRHCGIGGLDMIEVVGEKIEDVKIEHFRLPKSSVLFNLPKPIFNAGVKALKLCPHIKKDQCRCCGLCFKICPKSAIKKSDTGEYRVDIRDCICCFCCYEVCPYKAITLKKSLMARIIMR